TVNPATFSLHDALPRSWIRDRTALAWSRGPCARNTASSHTEPIDETHDQPCGLRRPARSRRRLHQIGEHHDDTAVHTAGGIGERSEAHTSELQSREKLV